MKNTIRASHKNGNKTASAQLKKPTIHGQNTATIGHIKLKVKGKVTFRALRIGEAIGLSGEEITALALLANWEGKTLKQYCGEAIQFVMQTTVEEAERQIGDDRTERADETAKLLGSLPNIFRRVPVAPERSEQLSVSINREKLISQKDSLCDAITKFEHVKFEIKALFALLVSYLDAKAATSPDAYGVSRLADSVQHNLERAFEDVHGARLLIFPPTA